MCVWGGVVVYVVTQVLLQWRDEPLPDPQPLPTLFPPSLMCQMRKEQESNNTEKCFPGLFAARQSAEGRTGEEGVLKLGHLLPDS